MPSCFSKESPTKMVKLFRNYRLPENSDLLFMLIFGILLQIPDGSPFTLEDRWKVVWEIELPQQHFSPLMQKCIKSVLSVIVVVRCVTTYAYVVFAMLALFCLLKGSCPKLLLPWLFVAGVKSIFMTFAEALTGVYVCSAFGKIHKACIEFFISKALEIIFAAYLWGNLLNIYQEMERKMESNKKVDVWEQMYIQKMDFKHQRARSMVDESTLYKTACLNYFEFKDVPQIILQMLKRNDQMSQDSLLGPGMMLASVSNLGSLDTLKTSQSLGELGYVDLDTTQVIGLEEEENLSPQEKAMKFLKLTWSDVRAAKRNKGQIVSDVYTVNQDIWDRVTASGVHLNKPKEARPQVFWRDIPQDSSEDNINKIARKESINVKFGLSLFSVFQGKESEGDVIEGQKGNNEEEEEEEEIEEREEELEGEYDMEDEEDKPLYFMSNIREEVVVNRIRLDFVSKRMNGNTYGKLLKEHYMNVIGPEVFDRATKLPKVTSLRRNVDARSSASSPAFSATPEQYSKKIFFDEDLSRASSDFYIHDISIADLEKSLSLEDFVPEEIEKVKQRRETPLILKPEEKLPEVDNNPQEEKKPETKILSFQRYSREENNDEKPGGSRWFRKRKIVIKRIGKPRRVNTRDSISISSENSSNNSDSCFDVPLTCDEDDKNSHSDTDNRSCSSKSDYSCDSDKDVQWKTQIKHVYFLTELLQKPLFEVLLTYYDLKKRVHVQRPHSPFLDEVESHKTFQLHRYESLLDSPYSDRRDAKVWKSKVLKTAATYHEPRDKSKYFLTVPEREIVMRKYLRGVSSVFKAKRKISARIRDKRKMSTSKRQSRQSIIGLEVNDHFIPLVLLGVKDCESKAVEDCQNSEIVLAQDLAENFSSGSDMSALTEKPLSISTLSASLRDAEGNVIIKCDSPEVEHINFLCRRSQRIMSDDESNLEILKSETDLESLKSEVDRTEETAPEVVSNCPEEDSSCREESDESISLYYSKAADLASPLLDMKRFIYPDHIHYSYKHVKKKGFDVDINGGLPLLVRESLTMNSPVNKKKVPVSKSPQCEITRRPMDLSFAESNAFAEWQNNDQKDGDSITSEKPNIWQKPGNSSSLKKNRKSTGTSKKGKKIRLPKNNEDEDQSKTTLRIFNDIKHLYSSKDYALIEKLLRMHMMQNSREESKSSSTEKERTPVQISSTQLHSNKGRISSTYNPAIFLQENRTRHERKMETQEKRTKDMFARLEREVLLHSRHVHKSFGSARRK